MFTWTDSDFSQDQFYSAENEILSPILYLRTLSIAVSNIWNNSEKGQRNKQPNIWLVMKTLKYPNLTDRLFNSSWGKKMDLKESGFHMYTALLEGSLLFRSNQKSEWTLALRINRVVSTQLRILLHNKGKCTLRAIPFTNLQVVGKHTHYCIEQLSIIHRPAQSMIKCMRKL